MEMVLTAHPIYVLHALVSGIHFICILKLLPEYFTDLDVGVLTLKSIPHGHIISVHHRIRKLCFSFSPNILVPPWNIIIAYGNLFIIPANLHDKTLYLVTIWQTFKPFLFGQLIFFLFKLLDDLIKLWQH